MMKVPVIILEGVYLPGVHGELFVDREIGKALDSFGKLEGFGCLEVILASPKDPTLPPGPDNIAPMGALVELLISEEDLEVDARKVRLDVGDGHRIKILDPEAKTTIHGQPWQGILASFKSRKPSVNGLSKERWQELQSMFYRWLLTNHDHVGPRAVSSSPLEEIAGPVLEIERWGAPDWKVAYMVADRTLSEPSERYRMLEFNDTGEAVLGLELETRLQDAQLTAQSTARYGDVLEEILEQGLDQSRAAIEAMAVLAQKEVLPLPGGTSKTLRNIEQDLEKMARTIESVVEQINRRAHKRED